MSSDAAAPANRYSGFFGWLYRMKDWVESLAATPHAKTALFVIAFIESIFFPIPVDVLLIALCVSRPKQAFLFAIICTLGSVAGAGLGYAIGYWLWYGTDGTFSDLAIFFFNHIPGFTVPLFEEVGKRYQDYGVQVVLTAAFTPIPFKLITVTAGVFKLNFWMFFFSSIFGRAARFFLVATLFYFYGKPIKAFIDKHLGWLSILFVALVLGGFVVLKYVL